jgi:hypothetical protein
VILEQGAAYAPIRWEDRWFRGEDRKLLFLVLDDAGLIPVDLATWDFLWALLEEAGDAPLLSLTSPTQISVVSAPDPRDPLGPNVDQVQVSIARADTQDLLWGEYWHALIRTDTGDWRHIAEGEAFLRPGATI